MADMKRHSGRQGASLGQDSGTSGKSPIGKVNPVSSGVGRIAPPSNSNLKPGSAQSSRSHMLPAAHIPKSSTRIIAPGVLPSNISRRSESVRSSQRSKRTGPELLIAGGVIAALTVIAGILYVVRQGQQRESDALKGEQNSELLANLTVTKEVLTKAHETGLLWVLGKNPDKEDKAEEILFAPFKADPNVYNIIYERFSVDKRFQPQNVKIPMYKDRKTEGKFDIAGTRMERIPQFKADSDTTYKYALAESKTVMLVSAIKSIKGEPDNKINTGGTIEVIIRAKNDKDDLFSNALKPKKKEVEQPPK